MRAAWRGYQSRPSDTQSTWIACTSDDQNPSATLCCNDPGEGRFAGTCDVTYTGEKSRVEGTNFCVDPSTGYECPYASPYADLLDSGPVRTRCNHMWATGPDDQPSGNNPVDEYGKSSSLAKDTCANAHLAIMDGLNPSTNPDQLAHITSPSDSLLDCDAGVDCVNDGLSPRGIQYCNPSITECGGLPWPIVPYLAQASCTTCGCRTCAPWKSPPHPGGGCQSCVSGGGDLSCLPQCGVCGSACTGCISDGSGKACASLCCPGPGTLLGCKYSTTTIPPDQYTAGGTVVNQCYGGRVTTTGYRRHLGHLPRSGQPVSGAAPALVCYAEVRQR